MKYTLLVLCLVILYTSVNSHGHRRHYYFDDDSDVWSGSVDHYRHRRQAYSPQQTPHIYAQFPGHRAAGGPGAPPRQLQAIPIQARPTERNNKPTVIELGTYPLTAFSPSAQIFHQNSPSSPRPPLTSATAASTQIPVRSQQQFDYQQQQQQQQQKKQQRPKPKPRPIIYEDENDADSDFQQAFVLPPRAQQLRPSEGGPQYAPKGNSLRGNAKGRPQLLEEEPEEEEPDRLSILLQDSDFHCHDKKDGYYADVKLDCEVFHYCQDSGKHSWICPEGFRFHQVHLICMPPGSDNICQKSSQYHFVNDFLYQPVEQDENNETLRYADRYFPDDFSAGSFDGQAQQQQQYVQPRPATPVSVSSRPPQQQSQSRLQQLPQIFRGQIEDIRAGRPVQQHPSQQQRQHSQQPQQRQALQQQQQSRPVLQQQSQPVVYRAQNPQNQGQINPQFRPVQQRSNIKQVEEDDDEDHDFEGIGYFRG